MGVVRKERREGEEGDEDEGEEEGGRGPWKGSRPSANFGRPIGFRAAANLSKRIL